MGELMSAGFRPGGINPICGASVWKSFGIPTMLYGCELWSRLTATEEKMLNRGHTFAAKRMQGLCQTTHSEAALGAIGLWSITGFIDKSKLLFLGNLFRIGPLLLEKQLFVKRLFSFLIENNPKQAGFVPDIIRILKLYDLYQYLENYIQHCIFPSKTVWRNMVIDSINEHQLQTWKARMLEKPNLRYIRHTHHQLKPIVHWESAKRNPINRAVIANLVNLYCGNVPALILDAVEEDESWYVCKICKRQLLEVGYHFVMDCIGTIEPRNEMWENLTNQLAIQDVSLLNNLQDEDLYETLISGKFMSTQNNKNTTDKFVILVAHAVMSIFKRVTELV